MDDLLIVFAVAFICACMPPILANALHLNTTVKVPCTYTKMDGFNKVQYHAYCEV